MLIKLYVAWALYVSLSDLCAHFSMCCWCLLQAAYVIGLGVAFAANAITKLGQPALLYLVPATFLAITATAASRGEVQRLWKYTDTTAISPMKKAKGKVAEPERDQ